MLELELTFIITSNPFHLLLCIEVTRYVIMQYENSILFIETESWISLNFWKYEKNIIKV